MKQEDFKRVIDSFEPSEEMKNKILSMNKPKVRMRRRLVTAAAAFTVFLLTSATVFAAVNYLDLARLFRSTFEDDVTAENIEKGQIQKLDLTQSNDEISLTLDSFMGDSETHIVLFEMEYFGDINGSIDRIMLNGKTTNVIVNDAEKENYLATSFEAYDVTEESNNNKKIYGKYILPPHWVRDTAEDLVIDITGVDIWVNNSLETIHVNTDFEYTFSPDRMILKPALIIPVNEAITKDENTLTIDEIVFSQYKTELKCTIQEEVSSMHQGKAIWERFSFDFYHEANSYQWVKNDCYIRLFVDGNELEADDKFKDYYPGSGRYCSVLFQPVDYSSAKNIEIHFGDKVIPVTVPEDLKEEITSTISSEADAESKAQEENINEEETAFKGLVSEDQVWVTGNTSLNYMWNGNICADRDVIYYSNDQDHGYLYKREEDGSKSKIYEAAVNNINVMDGVIYFTNKDDNSSICRIDPNGENYRVIRPGIAYRLMLTPDQIFFMDKDCVLYRMNYDGQQASRITELNEDEIWWVNVYKNYLIYSRKNNDFAVYCYDTMNDKEFKILDYGFFPTVYGDYLYYQSEEGVNQCSLIEGSKKVLTEKWGQQFAVVRNTIYFTDYRTVWKYPLGGSTPPEIVFTSVNKDDPEHWVYLDIRINMLYAGKEDVYFDITEDGKDKLLIYHTDTGVMEEF